MPQQISRKKIAKFLRLFPCLSKCNSYSLLLQVALRRLPCLLPKVIILTTSKSSLSGPSPSLVPTMFPVPIITGHSLKPMLCAPSSISNILPFTNSNLSLYIMHIYKECMELPIKCGNPQYPHAKNVRYLQKKIPDV